MPPHVGQDKRGFEGPSRISQGMVRRRGRCRICRKYRALDPHHIISQGHAKKTGQDDLISNQGNVVLICRKCHDQTTSSMVRKHLEEKDSKKSKPRSLSKPKPKPKPRSEWRCSRCGRTSHNRTQCYAQTIASDLSKKDSKKYSKRIRED